MAAIVVILFSIEHHLRVHAGAYMASGLALLPFVVGIAFLPGIQLAGLGSLLLFLNINELLSHPFLLAKGGVVRLVFRFLIVGVGVGIGLYRERLERRELILEQGVKSLNRRLAAKDRLNHLARCLQGPLYGLRSEIDHFLGLLASSKASTGFNEYSRLKQCNSLINSASLFVPILQDALLLNPVLACLDESISLKSSCFDLQAVLHSVIDSLAPRLVARDVEIIVDSKDQAPLLLEGFQDQTTSVLSCLILDAVTNQSAGNPSMGSNALRVALQRQGDCVVFSLTDAALVSRAESSWGDFSESGPLKSDSYLMAAVELLVAIFSWRLERGLCSSTRCGQWRLFIPCRPVIGF